jgi:MFS family permease
MCIIAAATATFTTAMYGLGQGPAIILCARVLWGLTYAVFVLATLSYAVEYRSKIGTRVGIGRAIQRLGPILVLFSGAWLVGHFGPNITFLLLAVPTALSLLIAFKLPISRGDATKRESPPSLARPKPIDVIYFLQGYGVDGVFAISITLIFARNASLSEAVMTGSALLAMRHFGEAIAAPLFGWIADRFGARRVFVTAAFMTTVGFGLVALGLTIFGALIMLIFHGALASLGPAVVTQELSVDDDPIGPLARMQAWRDFGAACGPLITGYLLTILSAETLHAAVAVALTVSLLYWLSVLDR